MQAEELSRSFNDKIRRGMFKSVARHLTNPDTAEDRMQEGLALTWEMYQRYALEKDVVLDDAVLVHACRQRACDHGRTLVRDGKCRLHDAMSERAYHAGRVEVFRLDVWTDDDSEEDDGHPHQIGMAEELCPSPERASGRTSWLETSAWIRHGSTNCSMVGSSLRPKRSSVSAGTWKSEEHNLTSPSGYWDSRRSCDSASQLMSLRT